MHSCHGGQRKIREHKKNVDGSIVQGMSVTGYFTLLYEYVNTCLSFAFFHTHSNGARKGIVKCVISQQLNSFFFLLQCKFLIAHCHGVYFSQTFVKVKQ